MQQNVKRRHFLQWGAAGIGAVLLGRQAGAAAICGQTPDQMPGPFYPGENLFSQAHDLTSVPGASAPALGQVIYVQGVVRDIHCNPISNVNIEIWQACASGRYNNPNDTNTAPLDPGFKYWGETSSDANGAYLFKTIIPGAYPADVDWERPPHIHFQLSKKRFQDLITQMYFKGQTLNVADKILQQVPVHLRDSVIVDFQPHPTEAGSQVGTFDITLLSV